MLGARGYYFLHEAAALAAPPPTLLLLHCVSYTQSKMLGSTFCNARSFEPEEIARECMCGICPFAFHL